MTAKARLQLTLGRYHLLLYAAVFSGIALFWPHADAPTAGIRLYLLAATAGYAGLYILPAVLANNVLLRFLVQGDTPRRWTIRTVSAIAVATGSTTLLVIYADYRLYLLYDYHINGFVWNLITTPGGIAALGATTATETTAVLQAALFVLGTTGALLLAGRLPGNAGAPSRRRTAAALAGTVTLLAATESVYAYSVHTGGESVLTATDAIPFHLRSSATRLFKALGVERTAVKELRLAGGIVDYPGATLPVDHAAKPLNVVMLVAESFRWDLLTPEITPNLWKLSQRGLRFENHYSGGNRTRMGMFSMFYGIYAPYWYSFERQRVAPALMKFFTDRGYRIAANTSQSFTYPELDHTVFAGVDAADMHADAAGEPWQRDIRNIDDLIAKTGRRDPARPFYEFMFFESTHAPYSFPEDKALRSGYLRDFDYIRLDLADNIDGIHLRYINAAHHIDEQVGRLLSRLEEKGLMDDTIVLFTGDHGEEFMEKGRWGHGHGNTFPEEQIRVPLVLWVPGKPAQAIRYRTSHLQIPSTLLQLLGVTAPPRSYSSADPLFTPMSTFVIGEYDHMSIVDVEKKITFPYTGADFFRYRVYGSDDLPFTRERGQQVIAESRALIDGVVLESMRFLKKPETQPHSATAASKGDGAPG